MKAWETIYKRFLQVRDTIGQRQIANAAAATAFWFFLSLVPMVILAVSVLPYTVLTEEQLLTFIAPVIPGSLSELINVIVSDVYQNSMAVLPISFIATLWSAARGFSSLIRGLEDIYQRERRSGFFRRRARGAVSTVGMLLFILLSIVIGGFGHQLVELAERFLPGAAGFFRFLLNLRFLLVIAVLTVFFGAVYRWGTSYRPSLQQILPGALLSAVGWSGFTGAFSAWVSVNRFSTYGSLATVVVVMLWMYYCQYILLLGACFNSAVPRKNTDTT